jgi:hypothetical protein
MLDSLSPQLTEKDCVTIVFDGFSTIPIFDTSNFKCNVHMYCEPVVLGFYGHGIRNKYSRILEPRDFVMHADDDDTYIPESFEKLRNICISTNMLYIARMNSNGTIIPRSDNKIYLGNIGTPCGIIPYELNTKGNWEHRYCGDGIFYIQLEKYVIPTFLNEIIYMVGK